MSNAFEQSAIVSETIDMDQPPSDSKLSEEGCCAYIGRDAGGQDETAAASRIDDRAGGFGEDGVGIDITVAGEPVAR